jgi:hypothetical protein
MKLVLVAAAIVAVVLYLEAIPRQEPFSIEFKTSMDGKLFKSIHSGPAAIVSGIGSQAKKMTYAAMSVVPFRHKIREWKRNWKRRNM